MKRQTLTLLYGYGENISSNDRQIQFFKNAGGQTIIHEKDVGYIPQSSSQEWVKRIEEADFKTRYHFFGTLTTDNDIEVYKVFETRGDKRVVLSWDDMAYICVVLDFNIIPREEFKDGR